MFCRTGRAWTEIGICHSPSFACRYEDKEAVPLGNVMRVPRRAPVLALGKRRSDEFNKQQDGT